MLLEDRRLKWKRSLVFQSLLLYRSWNQRGIIMIWDGVTLRNIEPLNRTKTSRMGKSRRPNTRCNQNAHEEIHRAARKSFRDECEELKASFGSPIKGPQKRLRLRIKTRKEKRLEK
jgi:hypothetical protein